MPKKLWFDEVSVTNGHVGDVDQPSIFRRVHRLDESNYRQLLFRKQVTKRVGFSADHTYLRGADLIHQAVRVKPTGAFFSTLLFEAYERVSSPGGYGFNVFAERAASKRLAFSGGFARIDKHLTLNADRFPPGKRLYLSAVYKLSPELSLTPFLIKVSAASPLGHSTHTARCALHVERSRNTPASSRSLGLLAGP